MKAYNKKAQTIDNINNTITQAILKSADGVMAVCRRRVNKLSPTTKELLEKKFMKNGKQNTRAYAENNRTSREKNKKGIQVYQTK